jgi:hypothetical protein
MVSSVCEHSRQRRRIRNWSPLAAAISICVHLSQPAHADLLILESNAPEYKVGTIIKGDKIDEPHLCDGCYVRVLELSRNKTLLFQGQQLPKPPYGGTRGKSPEPK